MKKIASFLLFLLVCVFIIILFLSTAGIETKRLNNQISTVIKNYNTNLDIDLKKVKIVLDPFKFKLNLKTVGSKLKRKEKIIEIENIKTQISIQALLNNKFSLTNLQISTKSLELRNLISFSREFFNTPQLFFLEKIVKKGYLIADLDIEFDDKGKIKENFKVKGFVKDTEAIILKRYKIDKFNFIFNIKNQEYNFEDIDIQFNGLPLTSKNISIKDKKDTFFIEGTIKSKKTLIGKELISLIKVSNHSSFQLKDLFLGSENKFSFGINKKLKIKDLKINSKIKVDNLSVTNNTKLQKVFPKINEEILFSNQIIEMNYSKKNFLIQGKGEIFLQNKKDKITYSIDKKDKKYKILSTLEILNNPVTIDLLNYQNKDSSKVFIKFDGDYFLNGEIFIKYFSLNENENKFSVKNLLIDKNKSIQKLENISLNYKDIENIQNNLKITNKKDTFFLKGKSFNLSNLITNFIKEDSDNKRRIFSRDRNIDIDIDQVYLDKDNKVKNFRGKFIIKDNEIFKAKLDALFSQNKFLKFTVISNLDGKVTTLFLDNAEPAVRRYEFIKGFEKGSLDFYSLKKGKITRSTLKIYDFKLKELPILTKLLTLASLQGIADILSGEGIRFDEFEMNYQSQGKLMTINEIYAIGPAISVLMEGYVEKDKLVSLKGSLVPATTINKVIGSLPVLGKILVGSKTGEGVFGVSFKIKGPPKKLETTVNPIKTLTPRFITRTIEKIKKN
tara:strand:+ start:1308 stop:3497 length:2190 start_codon:yes stop_codon:yes gene_type:complete